MPEQPAPAWQLETSLVHAGERTPAPAAVPTTMPIYTSVTYLHPNLESLDSALGDTTDYTYTRYGNPTVAAFEQAMTMIEGGSGAVAFASGMAALHAALLAAGTPRGETVPQPRAILAARDMYGATQHLLDAFFVPRGTRVATCDMTDHAAVEQALANLKPEVVLVEQLTNPLLHILDIGWLAQRCKAAGARLVVDNTIATPLLQRPLTLGADLVVHSATKYIGGHGDVAGGVVVARAGLLRDTLRGQANVLGANLSPFAAQQLLRGLKTLALRFERQCANAAQVAAWLAQHPAAKRVYYPGLPGHPRHSLAQQAFGGKFGALVTFDMRQGERVALNRFFSALRLILPATTLGDLYTLASVPVMASHRELSPEERAARGISEGTVRLSIGIEAVADLLTDLEGALAA